MLRAIILALVVLVALGAMVPVATEQTEASAKQQERQFEKKVRADKFRYRTRFREAKYSHSKRYRSTAKLKIIKGTPAKRTVAKRTPVKRKVGSTKKIKRNTAVSKKRKVKRVRAKSTVRKTRSVKRYRKVRRTTAKKRTVKRTASSRTYKAKSVRTKRKTVRKYSAKWWRNYRARQQRQQAIAMRKQSMRIKRAELEEKRQAAKAAKESQSTMEFTIDGPTESEVQQPGMSFSDQDGAVSLEVIGPAVGDTVATGRNRTLGGVSTTALRRTVIDQMIKENGWVENDYHKDVAGNKVYVVIAKSPDKRNRVQARTFYFTESNGRIYRVSSKSASETSEEVVKQSEQMIKSLQVNQRPQQAVNQ